MGGRKGAPLQYLREIASHVGAVLAPARFVHKGRFYNAIDILMRNLGLRLFALAIIWEFRYNYFLVVRFIEII